MGTNSSIWIATIAMVMVAASAVVVVVGCSTPAADSANGGSARETTAGTAPTSAAVANPDWFHEHDQIEDEAGWFYRFGDAATEAEAVAKAETRATDAAAKYRQTNIRSIFRAIDQRNIRRRNGATVEIDESSETKSILSATTTVALAGATVGRRDAKPHGDGFRGWVRLKVPMNSLRPDRQLREWLARQPGISDGEAHGKWLDELPRLALEYQAVNEPELALLTLQYAVDWRGEWSDIERLATFYERADRHVRAIAVLERTRELMTDDQRRERRVDAWLDRLHAHLPEWNAAVQQFIERCREWRSAGGLALAVEMEESNLRIGGYLAMRADIAIEGFPTLIWIDADGVALWPRKHPDRPLEPWGNGRRRFDARGLNRAGRVWVVGIVGPEPTPVDDLLPIVSPTTSTARSVAIAKLRDLETRMATHVRNGLGTTIAVAVVELTITTE